MIMGVHIEDNKLVIITEPKTFRCDLPKNVGSLKHEMDFIIKYNEFLDEHTIRWQYKNNKLKIIALTWNDEFKLPDLYLHQQD